MALTMEQALKVVRHPLAAGVLKENVTVDALFSVLPFRPMSQAEESYTRENSLGSANWIARNSGTVAESSATFNTVRGIARTLVEDVDIPGLATELPSDPNNNVEVQVSRKLRKIGQQISDALINGGFVDGITVTSRPVGWNGDYVDALVAVSPHSDTTAGGTAFLKYTHAGTLLQYRAPGDDAFGTAVACASDGSFTLYSSNSSKWIRVTLDVSDADENGIVELTLTTTTYKPDGINAMIVPNGSQDITSSGTDGDAFSLAKLDRLITTVKTGLSARAFVMNGTLIEKFYAAVRAMGGADPQHMSLPGYNGPTPTYRGIPILRNDNIASTESKGAASTLSSAYLVSLDPEEGVSAWYVGGGEGAIADLDPMQKSLLGFRMERIGARQTKDASTIRCKWYGCFRLGSTLAVARARELITA